MTYEEIQELRNKYNQLDQKYKDFFKRIYGGDFDEIDISQHPTIKIQIENTLRKQLKESEKND